MMRRLIAIAVLLVAAGLFATGCILPEPGMHRQGGHGGRGGHGRCQTSCGQWAYRNSCYRSCGVRRGGVCVSYRQVCSRQRYCVRNVTRCR